MTATRRKKKKAWSKSFGEYGSRVRIFEDTDSGILYAEARDPASDPKRPRYLCRSLRHRDKSRAEQWAREQTIKLVTGDQSFRDPTPTVARVLSLYLTEQSPQKCASERQADERRAKLWTRVLGAKKDLSVLILREWNRFIEARGTGEIDPEGEPVPEDKRKQVRPATVAADLVFLRTVINWACKWQNSQGQYLMKENPARGFPMPQEKNPRRPVASQDRFQRVRGVADEVTMVVGRGETRREQPSFLKEVLDIVNGTGRRISAVLALKRHDVRRDHGPHGSIRWPADTDKTGRESLVPINVDVRAAIERILVESPLRPTAYLFPSPQDPSKHVSKELASAWLERAEQLAKLPKQDGSLWHAYRRKWVNERKHWPDTDVAAAGGWTDASTVTSVYQQADQETMQQVVSGPRVVREAPRE